MTRFEEVKDMTTEDYFNDNQFSIDAFNKKYTILDGETYVEALKRVCDYVASAEETDELKTFWSDRWFDEIYSDWWHPAGSIMQGAGNPRKISMGNCTTISLGVGDEDNEWDSLEGIIRGTAYSVAKTAAYRQGLGVDFSRIRPKGTAVHNSSNESEGAIHWMKFIDSIGYYVGQKGRVPAMLFSLNIKHPDVMDFIEVKKDYTKIQNANISVQITDDFYKAVKADGDWELKFTIPATKAGGRVLIDAHIKTEEAYSDDGELKEWHTVSHRDKEEEVISKTVKARALLNLIAKNMHANAEPGIQNIDIARRFSNSDAVYDPNDSYDSRIVSTNASVPFNTPILTRDGYKPIGASEGVRVDVWNGEEFSDVLIRETGQNKKVVKVSLSNGRSLTCTRDHVWKLKDDIDVEASELKIGDKLKKYNMPTIDFSGRFNNAYTHGFFCGDGQYNGKTGTGRGALLYGEKIKLKQYLNTKSKGELLKGDRVWVSFPKTLPDKNFVPTNVKIEDRLSWLAGLLDADGNIVRNKNSVSLALASVNREFLDKVQSMLTTLGVQAKINLMAKTGYRKMPNGNGGLKDYLCKATYRVLINATDTKTLIDLGLKTNRVDLSMITAPNRNASRFVKVQSIEDAGTEKKVYCFTEPKLHTGCFDGIIVGNCSEQYLSRDSLCILSSVNAGKFSEEHYNELNVIAPSMNRFLDNVNTLEIRDHRYATPIQKEAIEKLRRTGAGITNMAEFLFKDDLSYDSEKGAKAAELFTAHFNHALYRSSEALGKEKGSFGLFNKEKFKSSGFIKTLPENGFDFDHMRNVTVSSIAPTGTLSLMFRDMTMSSGIEPAFGLYYWKRTRMSGKYEYYFIVPHAVRVKFEELGIPLPMESDTIRDTWDGKHGKKVAEIIDANKDALNFKGAQEIAPLNKLNLVSKVAKHIDSSVSVTFMLAEDSTTEDVEEFIMKTHDVGLKSIAAFPDRRMYGIIAYTPFKDLAKTLKSEGVELHQQNFSEEELQELSMGSDNITVSTAPKRPKELDADIHAVSVKGERFIIAVGLLNGAPYEMFGGAMNGFNITSTKTGKILKLYRNKYKLVIDGGFEIEDFSEAFDPVEQVLFRMVSSNLRHGTPVKFVTEQLHKATDDLSSLTKAAARVLKKYISDGEPAHGLKCPTCGSTSLLYTDGCASCSCGFSKCD